MTEAPHLYLHGRPVEGYDEVHEHITPLKTYFVVFGALLVLTGLTYAVSYMSLGPASLPVAMIVATAKAALVCMFFMHLKYDDRYHVFVFLSTLIFVGIFFTFTIFDLNARAKLSEEQGTFFLRDNDRKPPPRPVVVGHAEGGEQAESSKEAHEAAVTEAEASEEKVEEAGAAKDDAKAAEPAKDDAEAAEPTKDDAEPTKDDAEPAKGDAEPTKNDAEP